MKKQILIHQLRRGQCKFPVTPDHALTHFFCGEPVEREGVVYCAEHAALCYDRRSAELRRAAKEKAMNARAHRRAPPTHLSGPRTPTTKDRLLAMGGSTRDDLP